MLCLEVEFLTGVSVAATPYACDEAEWPPHPDRLFRALVAAWGRDDPPDDAERRALEWLEGLDKDSLVVSAALSSRASISRRGVWNSTGRSQSASGAAWSRAPVFFSSSGR
jgi:CRISPR-associated protein Csb2